MTLQVVVDVADQIASMGAVPPGRRELIRSARHFGLMSWSNDSLGRAAHRCEEVCRSLPRGTEEPQRLEVCLRIAGATEEDLPSLIENYDFFEDLLAVVMSARRPEALSMVSSGKLTSYASWDAW